MYLPRDNWLVAKERGIEGRTHNGESKCDWRFRHFGIEFSDSFLTKWREPENIDHMLLVGLRILLKKDLQNSNHRRVFKKTSTSNQSLLIEGPSNAC